MIKLIAMDLDGTLFDSDHKTISERNIHAVQKAADRGIKIVICSGRTYCHMKSVLKQLNTVDYILASNGAVSMDKTGHVISSDCMKYDIWKAVYEILDGEGIVAEVYFDGKSYLKESSRNSYKSDKLNDDFVQELKADITFCDNPIRLLKDKAAEKITSIAVPEQQYDKLKRILLQMEVSVTSSIPLNIEINKMGVNKGKGLSALCDVLGICAEEVMAFGDGDNDIEMLQWAGYSYAMKNAAAHVRKAAKFTADYNHQDGIAKIIEKI